MDMAIAGHSSVDTTGDVTIAPHDFFLPEPEQVFFLYLFVVAKSVVSLMWNYMWDMLKAKAYNSCIAPQAAYHSCSGAVHVMDRAAYSL